MKGLLLCAGRGTRLRPYTHTRPKQLLPVAGVPIVLHAVAHLYSCGIRDIGLIVSDTYREVFHAVCGDTYRDATLTYLVQDHPLGLAHAINAARSFVGTDSCVVILGDNFFLGSLAPFVTQFETQRADALILVRKVKDPSPFGVAVLDGSRVRMLVEKPREFVSPFAILGVYAFRPTVFAAIDQLQPSARGEYEITDAIQAMVETGARVTAAHVKGWWRDAGRPADLLACNVRALQDIQPRRSSSAKVEQSQLSGAIQIGEHAEIVRSRIEGPVMIGPGVRVSDAQIGPGVVVGEGCVVRNCKLEHSVLLDRVHVMNVPTTIADSVIGADVTVLGQRQESPSMRLYVGDHSYLVIPDRSVPQ